MNPSEHLIDGPVPAGTISDQIEKLSADLNVGASAFFIGRVRADQSEGKTVAAIDYSAYPEMVESTIQSIKDELFKSFTDLHKVLILHSTGLVKAGEASLLVLVSAGHRTQSFQALEKCVELIKANLPVWKKEFFTDGTSRWIE
ncbi:MAG: molybdenum cofactor biosynthesis protein MoaE [Bacteroidota bacterium]